MLQNYLVIALRFMSRHRGFSLINIAGLTIGVACTLLILLYVQDERSYDTFHHDFEQISRITFRGKLQGKVTHTTLTGFEVARELDKHPAVASTLRLACWPTFPVRYKGKGFTEQRLLLADSNFFDFFSFKLIEGNPDSVLTGERKIVLSRSAAKRYFDYDGTGENSPLGQTLILAQGYTARVSGIVEDAPLTSHFHYSLILSMKSWEPFESRDLLNNKVLTYYKVKPGSPQSVHRELTERLNARLARELGERKLADLNAMKKQGDEARYLQQPLSSIHLRSHLEDEMETNGDIQYIYLFTSIAAFITLLACINFINLTTARSASRAREVAVRKTVGAPNGKLVGQFMLESYSYVFIAVFLAFFLLAILIGPFNYFTGKSIHLNSIFQPGFVGGILVFIVLTGLVAGSYPSFYLTRFSPVEVLRGNLRSHLRTFGIRNVLVVFQFFISACLIIATLVVYDQLRFMNKVDLGFNKENILNLLHTRNLEDKADVFKKEVLTIPGVISASYGNSLPPKINWESVTNIKGDKKNYLLGIYEMDYDHLNMLGLEMATGRFFSPQYNDSSSVILNETAMRKLGLSNHSGVVLTSAYDQYQRERRVIGVVKDFNYQSLKKPIQPLAIIFGYQPNLEMGIRIKPENQEETINRIEEVFRKYSEGAPFEYTFVDRNFDQTRRSEKHLAMLFFVFTTLAIFIACMGLFGLATFTAEQQRKAIGVRKVMGATTGHIVSLLNQSFLKLVLISNLLAWPVSYWLMYLWLKQFAYHIDVPLWTLLVAGGSTFFIALLTVSYRAIQAARQNPINSLRTE